MPARRARSSAAAPGRWSGRTTSSRPPPAATSTAIALLGAAARELQSPAPATAARFHAAALRLLPDRRAERDRIQARLADAQAAAGDAAGARETLLDALRTAAPEDRLGLTVAVANAEWWLGRTPEDARRRLHVALGELPAQPSPDRIRLRLALALTALMSVRPRTTRAGQAADARDDARAIGDPVFEAAALAAGALARRPRGRPGRRRRRRGGRRGAGAAHPRAARDAAAGVLDARRARGARSAGSRQRSRTSSAAPRSPSRPGASASCCVLHDRVRRRR